MSVSDLIKERMKEKDKPKEPKAKRSKAKTETGPVELDDLSSRVGESGLKRLGIKQEYERRETISASVPGWIKAALDFIAIKATEKGESQFSGFGGKSRFIAEALAAKLKEEFPDVFAKLQR